MATPFTGVSFGCCSEALSWADPSCRSRGIIRCRPPSRCDLSISHRTADDPEKTSSCTCAARPLPRSSLHPGVLRPTLQLGGSVFQSLQPLPFTVPDRCRGDAARELRCNDG